uniref:Tetraspanin n=1 Tax=Pavo cristatus TaxID=9049 RepID=A0A8C9F393_PAVCR
MGVWGHSVGKLWGAEAACRFWDSGHHPLQPNGGQEPIRLWGRAESLPGVHPSSLWLLPHGRSALSHPISDPGAQEGVPAASFPSRFWSPHPFCGSILSSSSPSWGWRGPELSSPLCRDERHCLQSPGVPMGVLSCMKYLMFIFNVLVFAGGICLVSVGVWVAVDPAGFQDIVAAKPVLSVGAYLLLAVGIALSLLGFLGCCGALRRSRPLLLVFFILVSLVFVTQLVGAVLFLAHWKQIRPELFLSELRRNYCGDEGAEVFSVAWNTLMVTVSGQEAPAGVWNTHGAAQGDCEHRDGSYGPQDTC